MYLHSVMVREKILEKDFEQKNTPEHTFPKADSRELSEQNRKLYSGDIGRILQNYLKVNIRELEVEINQQIEQKGNKMDEQQQQAIETALKTYPELSREDLTLAANFKATQTPIMQNFEDYIVPLEERRTIQSFRQLPIATIAMYVSTGNNAGEYWRHAMQDYVQAAQHIEKFASENPQVSPVQWARTTGNTYAGNGMAGKLIDSSNLFVEEIAQRPALKPFLDTYNANPDILQNASPTDIEIAVSQERLPENNKTYSQDNPYAAYAKDNEDVRQNADDWEMREPLTSEKLLHFNELAQKQGFTTYVENHHADTGVFQADKEIDKTYHIEITGQFKNHGSQDAFESARDFTMSFHQGDEIVHYFYTNQLDKALEQAAEFSKNPAQWIENKDKTVEQHLSDLVDETVAIMQKHSVIEQNRLPETSSQMQTPFDKKVREYVQLKADIRETDAILEEAYDYLNFVNRAEISPDELKTAENEVQSLQTRFDELSAQKSQIDKEYPTIWQAAGRFEQQQMAEMAKDANLSGNLKDEVKAIHQELAVESLEFQFTHKGLADRTVAFNQQLQQLAPEQLKELQPYFEQHKAIQTLQGLYEQTNDTARLEEINEHNRLIEWKIHNKVEAYLGKHIDYSDMDYYKGIKTGEELRQMMNDEQRLPENANRHIEPSGEISQNSSPALQGANDGVENRQSEKQSSVDEPKNFVQKFEDAHQNNTDKNQADLTTLGSISDPEIFQKMIMFNPVPEQEINQMIDEIIKERTYLAVDMEHKDTAKAAGAKWDKVLRAWYAEKGNLNEELQQFLPQQPEMTVQNRKQLSDFVAYARTIGVEISDLKENATGWVRCPVSGKGKNNRDGGYRLFRNDDGSIGATAKNYCTGDTVNWCDKVIGEKQVKSKVPLPDFIANKKQAEWNEIAKTTVDLKTEQQRAATAAAVYHQLPAALPTDPYIQRKGIVDIGKLRRLDDGSTIVPLYNNGRIANLQMIRTSDNEKRMMTQAIKQGAYYLIGNSRNPQVVLIAEGVATADSVHQIAVEIYGKDSVLTLSAIDSGNLKNVAEKVDKVYPDAQKIVAADNDAKNALEARLKYKNAGLEKAQQVVQEVQGFQVALCPALNDEKGQVKNTDWNDYLTAHGKEKAKQAFCRSLNGLQQTAVKSVEHKRNGTDGREL